MFSREDGNKKVLKKGKIEKFRKIYKTFKTGLKNLWPVFSFYHSIFFHVMKISENPDKIREFHIFYAISIFMKNWPKI